jgi:hypothetical protein
MEHPLGNRIEEGLQERSVTAAPSICPKCKGTVHFTETLLDVRRNLIVRLHRCECGEIIWEKTRVQARVSDANGLLYSPDTRSRTVAVSSMLIGFSPSTAEPATETVEYEIDVGLMTMGRRRAVHKDLDETSGDISLRAFRPKETVAPPLGSRVRPSAGPRGAA